MDIQFFTHGMSGLGRTSLSDEAGLADAVKQSEVSDGAGEEKDEIKDNDYNASSGPRF